MRVEKTYKVVYNACFGGFDLSKKAVDWLKERGVTLSEYDFDWNHRLRSHPLLVECVETLGEDVNVGYTKLTIAEVPVGEGYYIHEYDGNEEVITKDDFVYQWAEAELEATPFTQEDFKNHVVLSIEEARIIKHLLNLTYCTYILDKEQLEVDKKFIERLEQAEKENETEL